VPTFGCEVTYLLIAQFQCRRGYRLDALLYAIALGGPIARAARATEGRQKLARSTAGLGHSSSNSMTASTAATHCTSPNGLDKFCFERRMREKELQMTSEDLIELLEERPFVPLRVHLSNGRTHDIRHPEMAIVGQDIIAIGVETNEGSLPRIRLVSVAHINEVEPVPDSARADT
jgi:hypothetical protein